MTRCTLRILLVSLIVGVVPVHAASIPFTGTMTIQNEHLSVRVAGTPLPQVMEELSRLSGTQVLWLNGLAREEPVSVEFSDLPLSEGLNRILAGENFMLFYTSPAKRARLMQIWISSQGSGKPVFTTPAVSAAKRLSDSGEQDSPEQDEWASLPLERLQEIAMQDQDPSVREKAIMHLEVYAQTDPRAIITLTHLAQHDSNLQLQSTAAEVLQSLQGSSD